MQYIAFLRGIGPGNPNMRNDKLRGAFEDLGFKNVMSVISSGNVLFESDKTDIAELGRSIEDKMFEKLGFHSKTIIRSRSQLEAFAKLQPFGDMQHSRETSLNVTFLKHPLTKEQKAVTAPKNRDYKIVGMYDAAVCSVIDTTAEKTPNVMVWLEKTFTKEITTRTWATILKILKKWQNEI